MGYRVAVAGATGNVGRVLLEILAERRFPADEVIALASRRSVGVEVSYGGRRLACRELGRFDFSGIDIALFAAGSSAAEANAPRAANSGCVVVDNSSLYRYCEEVPLVVPEVNPDAIRAYSARNIVANPNCSTAQMVVAAKPLHDRARIRRIVVATYQSVSGAGKKHMDELWAQSRGMLTAGSAEPEHFSKRIAFNVIPHIDRFLEDGATREEWKMQAETARVLDPSIRVTATCVRVPVFVGHAEAINLEFESPVSVEQAKEALAEAPGVIVVDRTEDGGYSTPLDCVGTDAVYVSRIRRDPTIKNGLNLWCVSDNLRKGAALNAVQIAELLDRECLRRS